MAGPTMKILYGPPGTGKTWQAARDAVRAIEPDRFNDALLKADPQAALRQLHERLVSEGRILWVTFHPGYSYEDFMEGYRPIVDDAGQLAYRVVDGPFKTLCLRARFENDLQIGDQLQDASGRAAGIVVEKDTGGWVIRVTPNRADEVASTIDKYVPRYVIDRILEKGFSAHIFSIPGKGNFELADYGLDPADADIPAPQGEETPTTRSGSVIRKIIAARTGMFSSSDLSNSSHYGSVVRKIKELRTRGGSTAGTSVVMVIDEINRAEPSRVFGELLTLLEIDKRQGMTEERRIWLPYSKTLFTVPLNVSIIGTMNTVDRSLTALDFAMRRRFEFELVPPEASMVPAMYASVNVQQLFTRINSRIRVLLGIGFEFGHAFLMKSKLDSVKGLRGWSSEPDGELRALAYVLRSNLFPTLGEYFHDDFRKIRAVAGEARSEGVAISLFDSLSNDAAFTDRLPEEYEISESQSAVLANWWNPENTGWDPDKFRRFAVALSDGH